MLTGGRSSRMGRDKAMLPYHGSVLGDWVARAVSVAAGRVALVGGSGAIASLGYPVLPDLYPGEGPLGGILTVLQHDAADWNLIVACDMPEITVSLLAVLLETAEREDVDAVIPAGPSGRWEPLCAVYHRRSRASLEKSFAAGTRKVTEACAGLRVAVPRFAEIAPFQNVNTPEDWAGYAAR